jgi:hypothetical protein
MACVSCKENPCNCIAFRTTWCRSCKKITPECECVRTRPGTLPDEDEKHREQMQRLTTSGSIAWHKEVGLDPMGSVRAAIEQDPGWEPREAGRKVTKCGKCGKSYYSADEFMHEKCCLMCEYCGVVQSTLQKLGLHKRTHGRVFVF